MVNTVVFLDIRKDLLSMARKSRKHKSTESVYRKITYAVGCIRLSVKEKEDNNSVINQKIIIENWSEKNKIPIDHYYIDNGISGKNFERPAFKEMEKDILDGKISCIVVKDLLRFGRNYISTGYYIESFFPKYKVRFVSVNDQFDTSDGITNRICPYTSKIRIPLINVFNEQVIIENKKRQEEVLDMKANEGKFLGARAPFGYQKSDICSDQLVPDPMAAIIVQKIFELAAKETGVTGIVRYLNEKKIPTPMQYARSNGLTGNYDDGNGSWNSRSVKYILTNRTYTGMLVQGKEKRVVKGTHKPLVDSEIFDSIQKRFQANSFHIAASNQPVDNILKGKVICGCCGGKMQRKRGSNKANWYFFTCITKNRLGADKCTGMYIREEDVFSAIYYQLKIYLNKHLISEPQYKQVLHKFDEELNQLTETCKELWQYFIKQYEQFISGEITKEKFSMARDSRKTAENALKEVEERKEKYMKHYDILHTMACINRKERPLSDIMDAIAEIVIYADKKIRIKWVLD